jgi:hypothetical protein
MEQEEYIDLHDLDIIDEEIDENYNPSDEEILAYAEYLGFDYENDQELLIIAYQALKTPLPDNWKRAIIKNSQEVLYINLDDQTLHTFSPIDEAAIIHYREQKEQILLSKNEFMRSERENISVQENKIIPRAKNLPPIGKGNEKNKKKKMEKLNINNLNSDKKSIDSSEYVTHNQISN